MTQQPLSFPVFLIADVGGTTLRIGRMIAGSHTVQHVLRFPTEGLALYPGERGVELQRRVVDQLVATLTAYLLSAEGAGIEAVGIAFAGPLTAQGMVIAAPTIWGAGAPPLPLGKLLQKRIQLPVTVANDITAAAWRYSETEDQPFCLFTVSSGIGNKVFWRGEVLTGEDGHGGELGHWCVDQSAEAIACDCGGRGHLGAVASGRGVVAVAIRVAQRQPRRFFRSCLFEHARGQPERITSNALATAVRAGDLFAVNILHEALRPLASAIACLFAAIGIRRFLFIGGFATAVGGRFLSILGDELVRLGCFGLNEAATHAMLQLGVPDDDHSLIGMGRMLTTALVQQPVKR
jgi:predicted NBD/HSP70 family sugar kinase